MSGKDEPFAESAERFRRLLQEQADRAKRIGGRVEWLDYAKLDRLVIGVIGGDGIGPIIARETKRVMERLLKDELRSGRVEIREIGGLTIENRIKQMKPLPDEVFEEIKKCHVLLKGPTTTP
ncbi:MAG: isocitrate/isopropylmalate dehydrogenase family protein, partial [Nitrososphaerota archaeon]|nr:isocitrate/isopropylmalate dehydrogenase family protein [Nitrososphaerota archaeon]